MEVMECNGVSPHICFPQGLYHLKRAISPPALKHNPGFCTIINANTILPFSDCKECQLRRQLSIK